MDFINDLGKTLGQAARQLGEKSEELLEAGKINIEIFKQQDAVRKLQRRIGEQVSARYYEGQRYDEQINALCAEIQARNKSIDELKQKLSDLRKAEKPADRQPDEALGAVKSADFKKIRMFSAGPGITIDEPAKTYNLSRMNSKQALSLLAFIKNLWLYLPKQLCLYILHSCPYVNLISMVI